MTKQIAIIHDPYEPLVYSVYEVEHRLDNIDFAVHWSEAVERVTQNAEEQGNDYYTDNTILWLEGSGWKFTQKDFVVVVD